MAKTKILAQERPIALGLDVDRTVAVVAALDVSSGEILFQGRLTQEQEDWQRFLAHFPGCQLWVCYEAGYTGFHLCRMLREQGVDCRVVAPSQVPRSANSKQQKTDRRDALTLAQLYFHPPRSFVRIPTENEERDRQLLRTREQLVRDRTRTQNRIKALLAFHHATWPTAEIRGHWSIAERNALRRMELPAPLRVCLDTHLDALEALCTQIRSFDRQLIALSQTEPYHDRCARLRQLPGVGLLTAMAFLLEVFRPEEFLTAEALACHVGLTCCEWSSAQRRRQGHITHWGSPILRRMLVEAAWTWVRKDPHAARQFQILSASSKRKKIAIVAMARRLAIVMWAMTVREQDYAYHWAA
jgi:transposase